MRIKATPVKADDLEPGDLFSIGGPMYWDHFHEFDSVGEKVYIRTLTPTDKAVDPNAWVYRIEIIKEDGSVREPSNHPFD